MQAAKRVAINTGFLYTRMIITVFISLYATRLILNALGATDFGIFNLVGGAIAMLGFLNASMAAATQRFMSFAQGAGDKRKLKQIFNTSILLHIFIAAILLFLLEIAGYFFFNGILNIPPDKINDAALIYQFMVISTVFTVISVPYDAVINAHENMLLYAALGVIEAVLKLGIAFYVAQTSDNRLVTYGIMMAVLSIFLLLIRRIYCNRKYPECSLSFKSNYNKNLMKEMMSFASWSFLGSASSMLANYGQGIVLNVFFGTVVNAAQGIAAQVSGQLGAFSVTMLKALNPIIAKSEGAGDRSMMLKASIIGSKISFFMLTFFYIPFLLETPYILNLWLKNVPNYVIIFCQLLLVRNLIEQLFLTLDSTISAVGNIRNYQIYSSLLTFTPLPVTCLLFYFQYPAYTLYVVFIVYAILKSVIMLYYAKYNCGLSITEYFRDVISRCILLFVLTVGISYTPALLMEEGVLRLLSISFLSWVVLLILAGYIGLTGKERSYTGVMLKSTFKKLTVNLRLIKKLTPKYKVQ